MSAADTGNTDQIDYWNGQAGEKWVKEAAQLDRMLQPFIEAVLKAADVKRGQRALDVGCGAGALSRSVIEAGAGHVTGVDVSEPLLALARDRAGEAAHMTFIRADASNWQAEVPYDRLISRFGVMFFSDPVTAFANLRSQMAVDAKLAFACWQPLALNDWAFVPLQAVMPIAEAPPEIPPAGTPGPFAFADADRTVSILASAGWREAGVVPWTGQVRLPGRDIQETALFAMNIGPAARLMAQQALDENRVRAALESHLADVADANGHVYLDAAAWIVTATA